MPLVAAGHLEFRDYRADVYEWLNEEPQDRDELREALGV